MNKKITINSGEFSIKAELNDSNAADKIYNSLPLRGNINFWGEEIYFRIPVVCEQEEEKEVVDKGDLGYWIPGNAFCIFFGKTPASIGDEIRPASPVIIVGKVTGDLVLFSKMQESEDITIEKE